MRVLLLGHNGMLGHIVARYLSDKGIQVTTTNYRFSSEEFSQLVLNYNGDYIINCIGSIPQRTKNFEINYKLPEWLDNLALTKIIHPGTDCEMDDDEYGISKKKARDYIVSKGLKTKILKTSIIGPELNSSASLLEWFLNSEGEVGGYTKAMWSGITTLEWAKQCLELMNNWSNYRTETVLEGTCISKYTLLNMIKKIFNKDITIVPNGNVDLNKCLVGDIQTKTIAEQLEELKQYYYDFKS